MYIYIQVNTKIYLPESNFHPRQVNRVQVMYMATKRARVINRKKKSMRREPNKTNPRQSSPKEPENMRLKRDGRSKT